MTEHAELRERLRSCPNLPSSPTVAKRLIALMESPNPDVEEVVQVLSGDSALTAKILQLANSSFFPYKYKVTTLPKAAILIGYNGILATALSFTLVRHLRKEGSAGLDLDLFWRRSLLVASACRAIGDVCGQKDTEELFLVGLIHDIGMLALDRLIPDLYDSKTLNQSLHAEVVAHERQKLGVTHALVGSWLLADWNFPSKMCVAIEMSDDTQAFPASGGAEKFYNCVWLAVTLAGLILTHATDEKLLENMDLAESRLGVDPFAFALILKKVKGTVRETEMLFDMASHSEANLFQLTEQARSLLCSRHVQLTAQLDELFLERAMPGVG
ncbi:MAG: HDOD domain-containing protein [Nitrospirota bacterium]|nr:HDOD domain-containing protein [Nitrospirota bacterium]MDH5295519.1 HDOD domain-containing protein [Nitrospirota bacterium]